MYNINRFESGSFIWKGSFSMDNQIVMLNFDQSYIYQHFYRKEPVKWLDFTDMLGVHMFCEKSTAQQISKKLSTVTQGGITFLGGGNFHYISYLLLSRIEQPFSLVLFDHHTDMMPSPSEELISCGSWVLKALEKLPALQKVILIGVNELWREQIPHAFQHKLSVFPEHTSLTSQTIIDAIPTENIYISIDKDVLALSESRTNWDHGSLLLKDLIHMVKDFSRHKKLLGVDVCGEYPFTPQTAQQSRTKIALQKNDLANWRLLKAVQNLPLYHPMSSR